MTLEIGKNVAFIISNFIIGAIIVIGLIYTKDISCILPGMILVIADLVYLLN